MTATLSEKTVVLAPEKPETRVRTGTWTAANTYTLLGALGGSFAMVWLAYFRLLPFSGLAGFALCWYVAFLIFYAIAAALQWPLRMVRDQVVQVVVGSAGFFVLAVVVDQMVYAVFRGNSALRHGNFFTQTMATTGPLSPLNHGGVLHGVVGSLEQMALATIFSVPLGVLAALYLVEVNGVIARPLRIIVEAMTALPEIIAGLFIYAAVVITLGLQQSGFAASLALSVMMIPIVTRTSEVMLRLVPAGLREASYALGSSHWRTVWNVVLPTARSSLTTAVVLAMARAVGETSPVLLVSGFTKDMNYNPFAGSQVSLPLYIWNYVRYPQPEMVSRAFGAGLALMLLVLILFVLARVIGGRPAGELSPRARRRLDRESARHPVDPGPAPATDPDHEFVLDPDADGGIQWER